jgi:tetratricopeptide (TPR) repeat protein
LNTQLGNLNAALQDVNAYLSIDPYNGDFLYERANVKMKLGYNDDSILDDLNAAIKLKPNVGVFHYRKAVYLLNTNRVPAAKQAYTMAVQLGYRNINPDVARILGN